MAKRTIPPASELDANIISLVGVQNSFKAITAVESCGGHPEPGPGQRPAGEWTVTFKLSSDEHGWRALEYLAWFVNNDARRGGMNVRHEPFASPPYLNTPGECLVFHLTGWGGEVPEGFSRLLDETRRQSYVPPRPVRPN